MAGPGPVHCGPDLPAAQAAWWRETLVPLSSHPDRWVSLNRGWDREWERDQWLAASGAEMEHVSVRLHAAEVLVGPRWVPGTGAGCAGCAEARSRTVADHPLANRLTEPWVPPGPVRPLLREIASVALRRLADRPLRVGELYAIGGPASRRHQVPRSLACPVCAAAPVDLRRPSGEDGRPPQRSLWTNPEEPTVERDAGQDDPPHVDSGPGRGALPDVAALRARLVDSRYGPVQRIVVGGRQPFAMSMAVLPGSLVPGYGRGLTFDEAEFVALLEAYERLAGFPHDAPLLSEVAFRDIADHAVDPTTLGGYTAEQLTHPTCRVRACTPDTPMDWAWGFDLDHGRPWLVPADVAFYQYDYRYRRDRSRARLKLDGERVHFFHESSSGCALGAHPAEAALHALLELAERDAFLLAWHRAAQLPCIRLDSVTDPTSRRLLELIAGHGFDTHLLAATQDIDVPVVWALGVNSAAGYPATFSSAGSGVTAVSAARSALWELSQLVAQGAHWDRTGVEPMRDDPWRVVDLEDHLRLYTLPELRSRVMAVVGSREVDLEEAFPTWPRRPGITARGDVRAALEQARASYAAAGLHRIVLVDQSTRDHRDLGVSAVRAVVPGIIPMCFGQAHQRLVGLPRLRNALVSVNRADRPIPYDPHPFP